MKTCMSDFSEQHTAPEAENSPDGSIDQGKYLLLPSGSIVIYVLLHTQIMGSWLYIV